MTAITFTSRTDLTTRISDMLQHCDLTPDQYSQAIERVADAIAATDGFTYGQSYSEEEWDAILDQAAGGQDFADFVYSLFEDDEEDDEEDGPIKHHFTTNEDLAVYFSDMLQHFEFTPMQYECACKRMARAVSGLKSFDYDAWYTDGEWKSILDEAAEDKDFTEFVYDLVETVHCFFHDENDLIEYLKTIFDEDGWDSDDCKDEINHLKNALMEKTALMYQEGYTKAEWDAYFSQALEGKTIDAFVESFSCL